MTVSYRGFVDRKAEADLYVSYQGRYAVEPKQCERVAATLIRERTLDRAGRWLDIGCSTGNFVSFLTREMPDGWRFDGVDLMPQAINVANSRPLPTAHFHVGDVLTEDLFPDETFDVVSVMTVVYAFSDDEFEACVQTIRRLLTPGGYAVIFDYFHPWEANYEIVERSWYHPEGHPLHLRPISYAREAVQAAGFDVCEIRRFEIPGGLVRPIDPNDLTSYTLATDEGQFIMRGPLAQPYAHLVLRAA